MRNNLILLLLLSISLSSCEKVIDIDLNDSAKKYVIEGIVSDLPDESRVIITRTKNFDEDNAFAGVDGAMVQVTEEGGATYNFNEVGDGFYFPVSFAGSSGKNYTLTVTIGPETFTATCRMPEKVSFDSLYITNEILFTQERKVANVVYNDPAGKGNCYRFIEYVNGFKQTQQQVQNDDYTDGRSITAKLFYFTDDDDTGLNIESRDEVIVYMQCIDPAMYKYWFSLARSSIGVSGQATPSNPVSNMRGGALGYFSAHTEEMRTVIVP